jgi:F-type H+-transporting ATPase subunit a
MFIVGLAVLILLVSIPLIVRRRKLSPKGSYNAIEAICVFIREQIARPILGNDTDQFISFLWTLFFFIFALNLLGMVPSDKIVKVFTGRENYFGGPPTANIWVTGAMAIVAFFTSVGAGIARKGLWGFFASIAPPVPAWIMPLVYFSELVTILIRPFTLAIRLFANIFAGHLLLGTCVGLILIFKNYFVASASVIGVVAMSLLELLIAFIQAFIFTFLTAVYLGFSVKTEH